MMVACRRQLTLLLCLLFLFFIFFVGYSLGSRSTRVFKTRPETDQYKGHFFNFLPRHLPIPTSGPSRRHNDIGLQSWKSP
ncbi:protein IDA [Salix suchowensis]|nr:protein IDA [Salix suchowensis]